MNPLLEKEVEAFRGATVYTTEHFTQALERVWKAGVEDERDAWIQGLRCVGCGREHDNELSDTCAECFEED